MAKLSMINVNRVLLAGRLTRDPELRYTPTGTAVTTLPLAVKRVYLLKTGEKKEETCFINVVVWQKAAERCAEHLAKGAPVFVEGRLQSRSWEAEGGQKRSIIEVTALSVQFLEWPEKAPAEEAPPGEGEEAAPEEEVPF